MGNHQAVSLRKWTTQPVQRWIECTRLLLVRISPNNQCLVAVLIVNHSIINSSDNCSDKLLAKRPPTRPEQVSLVYVTADIVSRSHAI